MYIKITTCPSFPLFRLLANCILLLGSVNIPNTINWFFKDPIDSRHEVLGMGTLSYLTPSPLVFYSNNFLLPVSCPVSLFLSPSPFLPFLLWMKLIWLASLMLNVFVLAIKQVITFHRRICEATHSDEENVQAAQIFALCLARLIKVCLIISLTIRYNLVSIETLRSLSNMSVRPFKPFDSYVILSYNF